MGTQSGLTLCDPMDYIADLAPLSMGFSRQEYWSVLPFPSSGDLPDPGIEPGSPATQADSLLSELPGKPYGGSVVGNRSTIQETQVQSLGWEDSLKEEMAIHCSILAWEIPWTEQSGGLQTTGSQRVKRE